MSTCGDPVAVEQDTEAHEEYERTQQRSRSKAALRTTESDGDQSASGRGGTRELQDRRFGRASGVQLLHLALQHDRILSMNSAAISGNVAAAIPPSHLAYRNRFAVAGITVEVQGDTPESVDLGPQLLPFATESSAHDIEVQVEWKSTIEPACGRELFDSGCLWSVHRSGGGFVFDFSTERLGIRPYKRLAVDEDFLRATVILNRECLTDEDATRALEYPLDELLITHFLSLGRGVELHACGMVRSDRESFLFVGHSGAGKSTTTRLWKRHASVEVLSDDRIIVRRAVADPTKAAGPETPAHTFLMHGTPWHGEAAFASPERAQVRRIFLLEHGTGNRIERLSKSAAVGELLARSFTPFYQSRFVDPVLAFLEELVESLPCYRFQFVPDQSAVERILAFRD